MYVTNYLHNTTYRNKVTDSGQKPMLCTVNVKSLDFQPGLLSLALDNRTEYYHAQIYEFLTSNKMYINVSHALTTGSQVTQNYNNSPDHTPTNFQNYLHAPD